MNKKQIEILRHTLGADSKKPGFRNHFTCYAKSDSYQEIAGLVDSGLMRQNWVQQSQSGSALGEYYCFSATDLGQAIIGVKETE